MLDVDARQAVLGDDGPVIAEDARVGLAHVDHRLDGQHQARFEAEIDFFVSRLTKLGTCGFSCMMRPMPWPTYCSTTLKPALSAWRCIRDGDLRPPAALRHFVDGDLQHLLADFDQPASLGADVADRHGDGGVGAPAVELAGGVDLDQVAVADFAVAGNAVDDLFVERDAGDGRETAPSGRR